MAPGKDATISAKLATTARARLPAKRTDIFFTCMRSIPSSISRREQLALSSTRR